MTKHLKGLIQFTEKFRGFHEAFNESIQKAIDLSINSVFPSIRVTKKKKIPGQIVDDDI